MNVFVLIRLLFNRAIKDKAVSTELYPFGTGKFKIKFPETIKIGLTEKEIRAFEKIEDLSNIERHSLNVWVYSFYFAGMRISDVYLLDGRKFTMGGYIIEWVKTENYYP